MAARPLMVCKPLEGSQQNDCKLEGRRRSKCTNTHTQSAGEANEQIIKGQENQSGKQVFWAESISKPVAQQRRVLGFGVISCSKQVYKLECFAAGFNA